MTTAPLLAPSDGADLAALNAASLPDTAAVGRLARTPRPGGGGDLAFVAARTGVPCRVTDTAARTALATGADQRTPPPARYRITFGAGQDLTDDQGRLASRLRVTVVRPGLPARVLDLALVSVAEHPVEVARVAWGDDAGEGA